MTIQSAVLALSVLLSAPVWSFNCYYTLAKDNCWSQYNVTVEVIDAGSSKVLTTVTVPTGQSWIRQSFTCQPNQKLMYHAQFTPIFWENGKGKIYSAVNFWSLPDEIKTGATAWNISVCFPADFAEVPMPPQATSSCRCDFSTIPTLKPQ